MKKITIALTALVMLLSTASFAGTTGNATPETVTAAFVKDFTGASNISWQKTSDFYFVDFTINEKNISAAYNERGELVGTSRRVSKEQLPLVVSMAVSKKFDGYQMPESVLELTYEGQTSYYVTVSNQKQSLYLKSDTNGDVMVQGRQKK